MIGTLFILAGLACLVIGADFVVRAASWLAASMGIRPIVLGITVVTAGTTMPELVVGVTAGLQGSGSLAIGNIAGTNVFNILFILGLSALLLPLSIDMKIFRVELPMIVVSAALMMGMALDGVLSRGDGLFLFAAGVLYTVALVRASHKESRATRQKYREVFGRIAAGISAKEVVRGRVWHALVLVAGIALCVVGAEWLVHGAVAVARTLGVSEALIGLTIVAVGTSAPELVTAIVSTLRGARDVAVGNIIGSCIYNILIILGITCIVSPGGVAVDRALIVFDIPFMAGIALACVPVFMTGKRVSRLEGAAGVILYFTYMTWLALTRL